MSSIRDRFRFVCLVGIAVFLVNRTHGQATAETNADGIHPYGIVRSETALLGTAWNGGANGAGTAWSLDLNTGEFAKLHDFASNPDGKQPGHVALMGETLYGVGITGGATAGNGVDHGTIWSIDLNSGAFVKLHDFTEQDGANPLGITVSGTTLFGAASGGGTNGAGTIWSFDTKSQQFATLHDFDDQSPFGLVSSGSKLYGTAIGGRDRSSMIWSLDTGTNEFTRLHESQAPDGPWPLLDVVASGPTLYGTASGGANDDGSIWRFDTNTEAFATLHEFHRDVDGLGPSGIVISDTTLYGVAETNGPGGDGTIWSLDLATEAFTKLHDFRTETDGASSQVTALSGTTLFGTAARGGANGNGTIWSFEFDTSTFTNLHNFSAVGDPPPLDTVIYDDGEQHVLNQTAQKVVLTNKSQLDLRADVSVVDVNDATLVHHDGRIDGVPATGRGLTLSNRASYRLNSGRVNGVDMDASTLVLNGGTISHWDCETLRAYNGSSVTLSGGGIGAADPSCKSLDVLDSSVLIDGAQVGGEKSFGGSSELTIRAGRVDNIDSSNITATDLTNVTITGGTIEAFHSNAIQLARSATLELSGGTVSGQGGIRASDEAVIMVWGGDVIGREESPIALSGSAQVKIAGGSLATEDADGGTYISIRENSSVTIYGSNFNFPLGELIDSTEGLITGILADGSSLSWSFRRTSDATIRLLPFISGDYGLNGDLDVDDLDQQAAAMKNSNAALNIYDENDDGRVDELDRAIWVHEYAGTSFGDANLNGTFDSGDLVEVFASGKFETGEASRWSDGDWDGNGLFDSGDLVFAFQDGGYDQTAQVAVTPVPEPPGKVLILLATTAVALVNRGKR